MNCFACNADLPEGALYCSWCGAPARRRRRAVRYAGFWRRLLAMIIDLILLYPAIELGKEILVQIAPPVERQVAVDYIGDRLSSAEKQAAEGKMMLWMAVLGTMVFFISGVYNVATESSGLRGSLGKRALGLRVTDHDGRRIRAGRAVVRHLARLLSGLPWMFGYLMAGFTAKKQALHDFVAGTVVIIADKAAERAQG